MTAQLFCSIQEFHNFVDAKIKNNVVAITKKKNKN